MTHNKSAFSIQPGTLEYKLYMMKLEYGAELGLEVNKTVPK